MSDSTSPPVSTVDSPYAELQRELRHIATLQSISGTLGWDQETYMPPAAAPLRAEQLSAVSSLAHERLISARVGELIAACEADTAVTGDEDEAANLRAIRHDHERATRLPTSLVRELAEASALGMHAWREARERNDFAAFAPHLVTLLGLNRQRAECMGVPEGGETYDALLEDYEPGMRAAELRRVFTALRGELTPLIRAVAESPHRPDTSWQSIPLAVERQAAFNRSVLERMGFDFSAGRLDVSAHPFCESPGPGDTRLTTRYSEDELAGALTASMHEAGHGLYEQGLPKAARFGQPLGEATSTGIHESQSRMWENFVGRGRPFWEWALPQMKRDVEVPAVQALDVETVWRGMNVVAPNLVRIESDEATYNLHIMLRFDLELAMLSGDLAVADLPGAWNDRIRADLGLEVPSDAMGCMQDIHWSMGAFGYFPTYTLGNLYAAQFWATIRAELPSLDEEIRAGDFAPLLGWLRANVHAHGRRYTAPELCRRITGQPLSHEPLIAYLREKLGPIYGV
ncbi:MAG: Thermostable carboxypeptidase 1 [Gemmatimonadetes bacterium]|nr:Thermostable carboxypeptidase 1 [Gemmatimonadota bacterium]